MRARRRSTEERALHEMRLGEARWRAVLTTSPDAIVAIDRDGIITLFNPTAESMFGYQADEVIGANVSTLMPSPYAEEHEAYLRTYQRTGEARAIGRVRSVSARRKDGQTFPIELSVSEVSTDGDVTYAAIIRDVSERDHLLQALRQERDFAEKLLGAAQVIVLVLDVAGRIVSFNRCLEEVSGYALDDVRGRDWFDTFLPHGDRPRIRKLFERAVRGKDVRANVNPIVTASGEEREIEWNARLLEGEGGEVDRVLCTGLDVTERKQALARLRAVEREAQQRQRLADIGAITAKVVHDIGNPLAALSMQAQLILRRARRAEFEPVEPVLKPVEQCLETLKRLQSLVREFNDVAREQRLRLTEVSLQTFAESLRQLWEPLASERGVDLSVSGSAELTLRADEDKLRRVLDNLIANSLDAISETSGSVRVCWSVPLDGKVRISVEDSGSGIPEGMNVFRLFETSKAHGTGLGLAVARQIVIAHGGTITHAAKAPHGTVFHVDLPIAGPATPLDDITVG